MSTTSDTKTSMDIDENSSDKEAKELEALVEEGVAFVSGLERRYARGHRELVQGLESYRKGEIKDRYSLQEKIRIAFVDRPYLLQEFLFIFVRRELIDSTPRLNPSSSKAAKTHESRDRRTEIENLPVEKYRRFRDLVAFHFEEKACVASNPVSNESHGPRSATGEVNDLCGSVAAPEIESEAVEKDGKGERDRPNYEDTGNM